MPFSFEVRSAAVLDDLSLFDRVRRRKTRLIRAVLLLRATLLSTSPCRGVDMENRPNVTEGVERLKGVFLEMPETSLIPDC